MISIEFINPIKNAERIVNSINNMTGDVILNIPSVEGLATEEYVDRKINSKVLAEDLATKNYVELYINELTENTLATQNFVQDYVGEAADTWLLEDYYTKDEVEAKYKAYVQAELATVEVDLTGYATEEYVAGQIAAIPEVDLEPYALKTDIPDVSDYQTAEQVNTLINEALGVIENGTY